jgi:hypothetical protein
MGKTTDGHIAKIDKLSHDCTDAAVAFSKALISATKIHKTLKAVEERMTALHNAFFLKGTVRTPEMEEQIELDPQYVQASAEFDFYNKHFLDVCDEKLDPAKQALRQGNAALAKSIKDFDAFVTAKEKSWFTSKQSVPKAREAIASAKDYLGSLQKLSVQIIKM